MERNMDMTKANGGSRWERAQAVVAAVRAADAQHGRWDELDAALESPVRVRVVDAGLGWEAMITSRFSGLPRNHLGADVMIDVYAQGVKVVSVRVTDGSSELVTFQPGPWEVAFGFPRRDWSPSVARRISRRVA